MQVNFKNIIAGTQLLGRIAKHGKDLACYMKKGFVCLQPKYLDWESGGGPHLGSLISGAFISIPLAGFGTHLARCPGLEA